MPAASRLRYLSLLPFVSWLTLHAQQPTHPAHRTFNLGDVRLESGAMLPDAKLLYVTAGRLDAARGNAVLVPSYAGGNHHGYDFLLGPGGGLDTAKYFVVLTEMFGSGGSSSPSNTPAPFDGPRFPQVTIRDNVAAAYRLLTQGLGIQHLRAVAGYSMGAQQSLQLAVSHPEFMDRAVAWCGNARTSPHGWMFLETGIRIWQADAAFAGGNYRARPMKGQAATAAHWASWVFSQEWWRRVSIGQNGPRPRRYSRSGRLTRRSRIRTTKSSSPGPGSSMMSATPPASRATSPARSARSGRRSSICRARPTSISPKPTSSKRAVRFLA
jgi:homoserine O-acetyltransferase/O-succinyltransferase